VPINDKAAHWKNFRLPGEPQGRKENTNLWVCVKLPKNGRESSALMTSGVHQVFQVFLEDKMIYRFGEFDSSGKGMFAGHKWHHIIDLPKDHEGKHVYFRIYSSFQHIGFSSLLIGEKSRLFIAIIKKDIPKLILGVFIAVVGVIALFYFVFGRKKKIGAEPIDKSIYFFFSIFSTFMGIAIVSDTAIKAHCTVFVFGFICARCISPFTASYLLILSDSAMRSLFAC
jgi:hypothetical protein